MKYYDKQLSAIYKDLKTSDKGLTDAEAVNRIGQYGYNELKEKKKKSPILMFLLQFNNFLIWILMVAIAISIILGDWIESIVIFIIVILNAVIGFVQEYKAEKAIDALKKLSGIRAEVLRKDKKIIDSRELVPGDIIFVETGHKIPADARIIEEANLEVQESSLTGESTSVLKNVSVLKGELPVADRKNMIFSGTTVTKGRAKAIVVKTGMETQIGKVATLIDQTIDELTPLQKKLDKFAKQLGWLIILISILVFAVVVIKESLITFTAGQLSYEKEAVLEILKTAVSLAVAAIPEGLPAVVALALALGIQRMIKRHALIRKLPSVETLGETTVICTDKTGTLICDQMTVRKIFTLGNEISVSGQGYSKEGKYSKELGKDEKLLLEIGVHCNDAEINEKSMFGDPTEAALIVSAAKANIEKETVDKYYPRIDEIPFDSERKLMSTVHKKDNKKLMYTKGATSILLKICTKILANGKERAITKKDIDEINKENENLANQALRVLAFAYKPLTGKPTEKDLVFVGLQAMIDPPRSEVKTAIQICKDAGIRVVMITGDHKLTAVAIAKELGITGKAITGIEIDKIQDLSQIVEKIGVYARVSPEHKIRIVDALQKKGEVTAMTGDGVNDAPALKKADIGIAMGISGTDVSREASKMILTDDNFASIVNAVEEGRAIYDNIKKFVFFLLSSNLAEVLIIFIAIIIGLKLPLVAIQILWINLLTDGAPALALGVEPTEKDIMKRKPRPPKEDIITKKMVIRLLIVGLTITVGTLGMFIWALMSKGWTWGAPLDVNGEIYIYALSISFTTLVVFELFNAFNSKSNVKNVFTSGLLHNKLLLGAIAVSAFLQILVLSAPFGNTFFNDVFKTTWLGWGDWALIILVSSTVLIADSIFKFIYNLREKEEVKA